LKVLGLENFSVHRFRAAESTSNDFTTKLMVRLSSPQATDTRDSEIDIFESLSFVLFATFVVKNVRFRFFTASANVAIGSWNEALVKVESFALRKGANQWLKRSFT
jgi:hypothetical protein